MSNVTNGDNLFSADIDSERMRPFSLKAIHLVNQEGMSVNLSGVTVGFRLYESINSKFITGDVGIIDSVNLLKHYRFTGQEYIRISLTHGEGDGEEEEGEVPPLLDMTFRVYKLSNQEQPKEIVQSYVLKICDPTMFIANTTRMSRVFRGSYSDMLLTAVNEVMQVPLTSIENWETTESDNHQFVCPNWKVSSFIDFIAGQADKGTDSAWRSGMFFYQTLRGGFQFRSIDQMCSGKTSSPDANAEPMNKVHEFISKPTTGAGDVQTRNQILEISKPQVFDTLLGTVKGAYASRSKTYDFVRKLEGDDRYDIEETFNRNKTGHVSGHPLLRTERMLNDGMERGLTTSNPLGTESPPVLTVPHFFSAPPNKQQDNLVIYDYNSNHDFDDNTDISTDEVFQGQHIKDNSKLERIALLELLQQHRTIITIPIRTDVSVGNIIQLHIPEPELQEGEQSNKDQINDNRYLVVDMCLTAVLLQSEGSLQLTCIKESFAKDITLEVLNTLLEKGSPPTIIDGGTES